jgi:peptide/nickel transport system permease protein
VCLTFFLSEFVPIDPTLLLASDSASASTYSEARAALGVDTPLFWRITDYFTKVFKGDLGTSLMTGRPVLDDLYRVFGASVELASISMTLALLGGIPLGILAAKNPRSIWNVLVELQVVIYSIPSFVLCIGALLVFYVFLQWLPGPGRCDILYANYECQSGFLLFESALHGDWQVFSSACLHSILPATILGIFTMTIISRMIRSIMSQELQKPYVLTATVKGISRSKILLRHVLRNMYLPMLTVIAMSFASLLEGAVITETIFSWPGIGKYVTQSLMMMDHNAFLGATLLLGVVFVTCNTTIDLFQPLLDPRCRL